MDVINRAEAVLILLFPIRRREPSVTRSPTPWPVWRSTLVGLRHDLTAPFGPEPLMTARDAAAVTPSQARTRPRPSMALEPSPSAFVRSSPCSPTGRRRPGTRAGPRAGVGRRGRRARPGVRGIARERRRAGRRPRRQARGRPLPGTPDNGEGVAAGVRSPVLRRGTELQKRALEDLAMPLSRTPGAGRRLCSRGAAGAGGRGCGR